MHFANKFLFAHEKKSDEECAFALWDGITGVTSRPIFLHSIWNVIMSILYHYNYKYNCLLHECVPKQQASTSKRNDRMYCVPSAHSEVQVIYYIKENIYIIFSGFSFFS